MVCNLFQLLQSLPVGWRTLAHKCVLSFTPSLTAKTRSGPTQKQTRQFCGGALSLPHPELRGTL